MVPLKLIVYVGLQGNRSQTGQVDVRCRHRQPDPKQELVQQLHAEPLLQLCSFPSLAHCYACADLTPEDGRVCSRQFCTNNQVGLLLVAGSETGLLIGGVGARSVSNIRQSNLGLMSWPFET